MVLLKETFEFKVDTEEQAAALIADQKNRSTGIVSNYKSTRKTKKEQDEIVAEWFIVSVTHQYGG
jgi:hypothetical protein